MTLFSKFTTGSRKPTEQPHLSSIVENLNNILNTTRGFGSPLCDYGISDMGGHMTRDHMARAIMKDVNECIERYERRVQVEEILFEDDNNPLRLSFKIKCTVRTSATSLQLVFDTIMGSVSVVGPDED